MEQSDYTITPDEILALEEYVHALQDEEFYREERNTPVGKSDPLIINVARQLVQFHQNQLGQYQSTITFEGRPYYLNYLIKEFEQVYAIKVRLHDDYGLILHLSHLYTESLKLNSRHRTLKKSMAELTGYDLYKIAMYVLQDLPKNS